MRTSLREYRCRWIGHVLIKPTNDITRVALRWTPEGKRRERPSKNSMEANCQKELKELNLTWGEEERIAKKTEKNGNP